MIRAFVVFALCATAASAETVRIATYHTELSRRGPALLLRDIARGQDDQVNAVLDIIEAAEADVLLLLDVDWDFEGRAVMALRAALSDRGLTYAHHVAPSPNSGRVSGFDLDGDGRLGRGRDALGYGRFMGDGGMVLLSRLPLGALTDHSDLLWVDRNPDARDVLPPGAEAVVPLASVAQWVVPLSVGGHDLSLITLNANTPVFDGPEDRNGIRNADELGLVADLAGTVPVPVVLGRSNVDPFDGAGDRGAMADLLNHPALQDPVPRGRGGGGDGHLGDPALDTVAFEGPGPLRVDYVLPAATLRVVDAGVIWPAPGDPLAEAAGAASRGRLVWVDIAFP
ncbi:endonuclease/exonuclease/phosphatase family protein [Jannaschia sp. 2305UL9-9]|uniref:endonuclease/exonuclease/phosphatase family protein n=1 Tax=Jannaschia sp. 2305UL9-9 TaxID=3121638 RepID=UPI003526FBD0